MPVLLILGGTLLHIRPLLLLRSRLLLGPLLLLWRSCLGLLPWTCRLLHLLPEDLLHILAESL